MLRFEPIYTFALWGGRRIETELGRVLPPGPIGESWELVDLGERQSLVAEGPHKGRALRELWLSGALGGSARGDFPCLVKWLDTEDKTSVQVHPDQAACDKLSKGRPKSEAWYVANADPGSVILLGHHPGLDAATLRQAAIGGTVHKWLYEVVPKVGDLLSVPAGTLHAIGGGFLLLEVQESSDTTFRVFDWRRIGLDGRPRELHLDEALVAVNFARVGPSKTQHQEVTGPRFMMRVWRGGSELAATGLRILIAEAGHTRLSTERGEATLELGDVVVMEPTDGRIRLISGSAVVVTEPPAAL
jgi:mannose-6-phosphate isomerase